MLERNDMYDVTIESAAVWEDKIYAVGRDAGVLFCFDMKTNFVEKILRMPDEDVLVNRLYNGVCVDKECLVLVPFNAKKIWYYNIKSKEWNSIEVDYYVKPKLEGKFVGGVLQNSILYLFGYRYKNVLCVNLITKEVQKMFEDGQHSFWGQSIVIDNNKVYAIDLGRNEILSINLTCQGKYEIIKVNGLPEAKENSNQGIAFDGTFFYIIKHHGNYVYKWRPNESALPIEIDHFYDKIEPFFNGGAVYGEKLFLYSPKGKNYILDLEENRNSCMIDKKIFGVKTMEELGLILCKKGKVSILNKKMKEIGCLETVLNCQEHSALYNSAKVQGKLLTENELFRLHDFLVSI